MESTFRSFLVVLLLFSAASSAEYSVRTIWRWLQPPVVAVERAAESASSAMERRIERSVRAGREIKAESAKGNRAAARTSEVVWKAYGN